MALNTPQSRYEAKNIRKMTFAFNRKTDADILTRLDAVENRQGYLKALIRADIEKGTK